MDVENTHNNNKIIRKSYQKDFFSFRDKIQEIKYRKHILIGFLKIHTPPKKRTEKK